MSEIRTRIAPSPTGDWHLGTARTALFTYLFARQHGGKFFLRIEDTDRNRLVEGAVDRILETMDWLSLDRDEYEGQPYVVQSEGLDRYQEVARQLVESGKAYYCFATPEELEAMRNEQSAAKLPPKYDNRWGYRELSLLEAEQRIAAGESYVIRQKMPQSGTITVHDIVHGDVAVEAALLDDHVLLKADGYPTYHLAHVIDDHDMRITHVIRGDEWLPSAPRHVALIEALGWELPQYVHLPIILGPDKGKLSKRHGAKPVLDYREAGYLPEALTNFLFLLGWSPADNQEIFSKSEMIEAFSLERLQPSPAVFNQVKLDWFNGEYIRSLVKSHTGATASFNSLSVEKDVAALRELLLDYADRSNQNWRALYAHSAEKFDNIVVASYERLKTLADFRPEVPYYSYEIAYDQEKLRGEGEKIEEIKALLSSIIEWRYSELKRVLDDFALQNRYKLGQVYLPLRYALTALPVSAGALECLVILGKETSIARIDNCLRALGHGQ